MKYADKVLSVLKTFFSASLNVCKRVWGFLREKRRYPFEFTKNFVIYIAVFLTALFFTQALRSHLSHIFFVFIILLPIVMVIYVLIAKATLNVYKHSETTTVEKLSPYTYEFKLINSGVLPYPFIDAYMELPQPNSVRTNERLVRLSMPPVSEYTVKNTVKFRFRGTYEIGIKYFYVYDLFRMFRVRVDFDNYDVIYVMPRQLFIRDSGTRAPSDEADRVKKVNFSYDRVEISDIRDYRMGDSLKSIHWKLSSKSEEFIVRDYDSGTTRRTYVFADMSARFPEKSPEIESESDEKKTKKNIKGKKADKSTSQGAKEYVKSRDASELSENKHYDDMNEFCADGVCELTVAAILRELREGNTCSLFWFDNRSSAGVCGYTVSGMEEFGSVFKIFSTAPLCKPKNSLRKLSSMVKDTQGIKLLFITSAMDPEALADYTTIAEQLDGASSGGAEIILYNPEERFLYKEDRRVYIENCRQELASHGMKLTDGILYEYPVL